MTIDNAPEAISLSATTNAGADDARFLNRELTWLEFNRRVLHEALDERTPLLERAGFLAIFNSNLDEFIQKRVGGLKRQIKAGVVSRTPDGMTPQQQLTAIRETILPMLRQQAECFAQIVKPRLAEQGIHLLNWSDLNQREQDVARDYFERNLFPVLTPLAVDPGHPFPFISNLSTSLGVMLRDPGSGTGDGRPHEIADEQAGRLQFARVKVPGVLPRWIQLASGDPNEGYRLVRLEEIVRHNLHELFAGMEIVRVEPFRITRNADVERDEEDAEDLLDLVEQELRDRRFANVVRLEVDSEPHLPMNQFLIRELKLGDQDVYEMPGELDYTNLWTVHSVGKPELKYEPWTPITPPRLADEDADMFQIIRQGDVFVHHPYESFGASVERFIKTAAADPNVIAIKQTLYRTSKDSPFIPELIRAAEAGKQVVALVELKARFDEERNVQIAQRLEKAGVHVVYGLVGLKTHTKTSMIVRHENEGMRVYAHIGTGNYNSKTANLYTDMGLFTCDPRLTGDLVEMFHFMTGRSIKHDFEHMLIAPINMRKRFVQMIDREIEHCKAWKKRGGDPNDPDRPRIIAKMNSLEDRKMCDKLYDASRAGVSIDLIVRGFCCLRPGVPGMSDNIRVMSIIGRFLEHSRIFIFHNQGSREYYIGSADWMYRNLNNRVEAICPIYDELAKRHLQELTDIMLADRRQAWDMQPDGSYIQRHPDPNNPAAAQGTHKTMMNLYRQGLHVRR